jgi:RHS repeat-associated protein
VAYQTNYTYDALNNLRKTDQGGQLRYFGYDSLSRLIFVRHVEQTINASLPSWTDPVTNYSGGWTAALTYDNNSNLVTRRDARNITTTFGYDQLNRATSVRYTNDPQNTPGIDIYYDGYRANQFTNISHVKGQAWQNETIGQVRFTIDNFDVIGRPKVQRQQFWSNNTWSNSYQVSVNYDLAGDVISQTYPSGHTVTYDPDQAGRLKSFTGNLGDGVSRTYANNFQYNDFGALQEEQFGTRIPLYHKLHYNLRGQLYDVRLSTLSLQANEFDWNRGCLAFYYGGYEWGQSGPNNNGNIVSQQHWVPADDSYSNYWYTTDSYNYDSLNRLVSTSEVHGGPSWQSGQDYQQIYNYDRWGNRTVDQNQTTPNVPRPNYTVDSNTNRLIAPAGYSFGYDSAGNQTNDTYTGGGQRVFDAENHMVSAQEYYGWQYYKYSGSGLRVRRIVNGVETWQVYGIGAGLLAEYQAGAASFVPTKEYGYRGGQLLTTISNGDAGRLSRFVYNLYYGALQRDPTAQELSDQINQLAAAGAQGQSQLYSTAAAMARSLFASTTYETNPNRSDGQYVADLYYAYLHRAPDDSGLAFWTGNAAGGVQNRMNVLNAFEGSAEFQTLVSTVYGTASSDNERTEHFVNNFYLAVFGVNATPTQLQQQRDRLNNAAALGYSNVQAEAEAMGRELLASQVTNFSINETQFVTNLYEAFLQRGPDAGGLAFWVSNAGTNNATQRQNVLNAFATCGSFRDLAGTLYREVFWLVADQLGTPRMVVDKSGSLASVKRHDYLPFGEEIGGAQVGLIGGRATTPGYVGDSVRQKFTGYESDGETGLNYAQARYQSSVQGRFTSVDPLGRSATITNPQSFNRYSYVLNSPTNLTDPLGLMAMDHGMDHNGAEPSSSDDDPPGDPFEKGSDIVAAAMAKFDGRVADTIFANGLNQLISSGRMTRDQAEAAIEGNDNLGIESVSAGAAEIGAQTQESGETLAAMTLDALRNNPGLYTELDTNRNPAVPVAVVACQAAKESGYSQLSQVPKAFIDGGSYRSTIRGADGEVGLLQVKPSTANLTEKSIEKVSVNVSATTNLLAALQTRFGGTEQALIAYNWGARKYQEYLDGKRQLFSGSASYAAKIMDCSRRLAPSLPQKPSSFRLFP